MYAFRCRNCLALVRAEAAGERTLPAACHVCGRGVHFVINAAGIPEKVYDDDNWVVLADLAPDELQPIMDYHSLAVSDVVAHIPFEPGVVQGTGAMVSAATSDGVATQDVIG
jgi:hypothetical protein